MAIKGELVIQYGKVTVACSSGMGITIDKLRETLDEVLAKHGYPEDTDIPDFNLDDKPGVEVKEDKTSKAPTMDKIEAVAKQIDKSGDAQIEKLQKEMR